MNSFSNSAFARFFTEFPKLLLAQLINAVAFAVFTALFVLIGYLTGFNNIIVWCLGIIPSMPFFAGLVMTVRKIGIEKKDVPVAKTFFGTVKENFKAFLLHGVVTYAIIACSIFAFMYYFSLLGSSLVYGSMLTVYVLFSLILTSMMFYVPIMSVTYELKISDIYKNSFILAFGNILKNILAMLFFIAVSLGFILWIAAAEGAMLVIAITVAVLFGRAALAAGRGVAAYRPSCMDDAERRDMLAMRAFDVELSRRGFASALAAGALSLALVGQIVAEASIDAPREYLIKHYLQKTGKNIVEATLLPAKEILNATEDFWNE